MAHWYKSIVLTILCVTAVSCLTSWDEEGLYVNEWAVKVDGGERVARDVAADHGFTYDGQIGNLRDTYAFLKKKMTTRSRRAAETYYQLLAGDTRVTWVEQQRVIGHAKKTADDVIPPDETGDDWAIPFNDPLWHKQWYLYNDGQKGATPGMDMNLMPAWKLGYTGKGIVVTIVDDGMDQNHPDLKDNFDMYASFDFNNRSNGHSPTPDYRKPATAIRHGTRCAGEVAAAANNSICGVGVAYEASIGGIRLLDGGATDRMTAEALQFNNSHVDIYSCCWGPVDDGARFEMPHTLTKEAFEHGTKTGRDGKGSIYVWAAGNGGHDDDHCGADGYVGDIHTIAISAINDHGRPSYFVESCPAIMAVTLSGGPASISELVDHRFRWNLVTTTDLYGNCTTGFVGTSSSAPLASGLFAVVLQANPQLTWRDLQYVITEGSKIPQPYNTGWTINGAGLHVHHDFGFGVLDGGKMVELAMTWDLVAPQQICEVDPIFPLVTLRQGQAQNITLSVDCPNVRSMEHVKAHISLEAYRRGDVSLVLYSPFGTPSRLIDTRIHDSNMEGLIDWPFMTVHNWGEDPNGEWTLEFRYNPTPDDAEQPEDELLNLSPRVQVHQATLALWGLTVYGISEPQERGDVDEAGGDAVEVDDEGNDENNPAVNPEDAGKSDQNTIRKIYNQEQLDSEEINLDLDQIANGVPLPPNRAHNINKITGAIGTEYFDGTLLNKQGLIKLAMFARGLEDGDQILRYLNSLDDESLQMLGRDFDLDNVMERVMTEDKKEDVGLKVTREEMVDETKEFALEEEQEDKRQDDEDDVAGEARDEEMTNTEIFRLLRALDASEVQLLMRAVEEMETKELNLNSLQSGQTFNHQERYVKKDDEVTVQVQKKTLDSLLDDLVYDPSKETNKRQEEEEEEEEEVEDKMKEIQFQKRIDDALLGRSSENLNGIGTSNVRERKGFVQELKTYENLEDKKLYEILRDLQELLEDD